ncbi:MULTISPECIES: sensor histidine kinase [unclassified Streptomyces]|uniref:sensor histidine kinase n=1 Tax=unclassified Streptomyces TaxID=2593676 RepID=UPI0036E04C20
MSPPGTGRCRRAPWICWSWPWSRGLPDWYAAANEPEYRQADWFTWLLLVISLLALVRRRRWPVAAVTGAACAGWALYGHIGELLNLPTLVALYTVAVQGDRRRTLWTGLIASLASGGVALWVGSEVVNPQGLPVLEMLWPLVPLLLGEVVRMRRQLLEEYAARATRAEEERERETARRVREEGVRIARELHDVVAHTVTAMTVQAGVALDAFEAQPETARQAMRQVRDSGKDAVRELRAAVGVLRDPASGDPVEPAPGIDRLAELVGRFAGGGTEITLRQEGVGEGLPPVVGLAAYRIVQEALTNVVKHSDARRAEVSVGRLDGTLVVEVVDDGRPAEMAVGGFGLIGMRERAVAVGGRIEYGPLPDGGFRVRAELPVDDSGGEGS